MNKNIKEKICKWVVWILRILIGGTFIVSGFTKIVDPWGFVYKIEEYLNVWGVDWLWREVVFCTAIFISLLEFTCGVLLLTGCLRRSVCQIMCALMAFMLPLSAYIAYASPVDSCGCFGEAIAISNTSTFVKNIFLTLGIVYLLFNNSKVQWLYPPLIQWMVIVASIAYCLALGIAGATIQPLVDFRPYKVGQRLLAETDIDAPIKLIYEKDGVRNEFTVDALPDSSWTYVERVVPETKEAASHGLGIFDGDIDVTADIISDEGEQLLLVVTDPEYHKKARSSMANSLNDYITTHGGTMYGIVATSPDSLSEWVKVAKPNFEVYTSEDTSLKELVRGDAGLVYLKDGIIQWKRNIYSLSGDFPDFESKDNELDKIYVVDSGKTIKDVTAIYASVLIFVFILGLFRVRKDKKIAQKTK